MRRYAVVGKPVRHSRSPWLHSLFAQRTQRDIAYAALCPQAGFAACCDAFFAAGGSGLNVTLPYKAEALAYAASASAFARRAGAANVLKREADGTVRACNTDGIGLLRDLQALCGGVAGKRVLLLGAGGAARAAAHALADAGAQLWLCNRTPAKAQALAAACGGECLPAPRRGAQIVINATAAAHQGGSLPWQAEIFADATLAYDLSYGAAAQEFLRCAAAGGAAQAADGSGMLAWQAAYTFALWEGVLPNAWQAAAALRQAALPAGS